MLSQEADRALQLLEDGASFNCTHTTARELIDEGLAMNDWGRLALTEAGRRKLRWRRGPWHKRNFELASEHVAELTPYIESAGERIDRTPSPVWHAEPSAEPNAERSLPPAAEDFTVTPPVAADFTARARQAAGVASGKTGVWVDEEWVTAFIEALDNHNDT